MFLFCCAAHRLSTPAAATAASSVVASLRDQPGALDDVGHWHAALERIAAGEARLDAAQQQVRALASLSDETSLDVSTADRDAARSSLIAVLSEALELHDADGGRTQLELGRSRVELGAQKLAVVFLRTLLRKKLDRWRTEKELVEQECAAKLQSIELQTRVELAEARHLKRIHAKEHLLLLRGI